MELTLEDLEDLIDVEEVLREAQDLLDQNASQYVASAQAALTSRNFSEMSPVEVLYALADDLVMVTGKSMRLDVVADFFDSVTWSEPFILGLLAMHCVLFITGFAVRNRPYAMITMMFGLGKLGV